MDSRALVTIINLDVVAPQLVGWKNHLSAPFPKDEETDGDYPWWARRYALRRLGKSEARLASEMMIGSKWAWLSE